MAEDKIAEANSFLEIYTGDTLDGNFASGVLHDQVLWQADDVRQLLRAAPINSMDAFTIPLGAHNSKNIESVTHILEGCVVLVPSGLVSKGVSELYPAVIAKSLAPKTVRLHVLDMPYRAKLQEGAAKILSAASQYEVAGIGEHDSGRVAKDSVEAEHFLTLLTAGTDDAVRATWQAGEHPNARWRNGEDAAGATAAGSVLAEVSKRLLGNDFKLHTISITESQLALGEACVLWHEGLEADNTVGVEIGDRPNALLVVQGLGHSAVKQAKQLDVVKGLMTSV